MPVAKAVSPNPSSCFMVPFSIGQSLMYTVYLLAIICVVQSGKRVEGWGRIGEKGIEYFLFVLICPTWPQLAHFRCVPGPLGAGTVPGELGDPGDASMLSV